MKKCIKCGIEKPLSEYYAKKQSIDGHKHDCKECVKIYQLEYRKKNSEWISVKRKLYNENNKERLNAKEHTEKRKQQKKDAVKRLKEKDPNYFARWMKNKKQKDPSFRIRLNLANRIIKAIKKNVKSKTTMDLLGISQEYFKTYLESKFLPTMTWENYGVEWHVDHIIPCDKFDLSDLEEQKKCFHYTNMQPLFKTTRVIEGVEYIGNLNKQNKIIS